MVQNNPSINGRAYSGGSIADSAVGAVGPHLIVKLFDTRIGTLSLGLDHA